LNVQSEQIALQGFRKTLLLVAEGDPMDAFSEILSGVKLNGVPKPIFQERVPSGSDSPRWRESHFT
jgi:hypothetical protein